MQTLQAFISPSSYSNVVLRPQRPQGPLGRGAQDGHLDFHTEFLRFKNSHEVLSPCTHTNSQRRFTTSSNHCYNWLRHSSSNHCHNWLRHSSSNHCHNWLRHSSSNHYHNWLRHSSSNHCHNRLQYSSSNHYHNWLQHSSSNHYHNWFRHRSPKTVS